jgi:rhodanese-related sulfurtransferase
MAPFPLDLIGMLGKAGNYGVYLLIGIAFGYVLEISGFNDSTRLAAQFYFKDLRVLKVMFTGIVVAMLLIFGSAAIGLLDYNLIFVPPTYLWPGILGGLIMGVGFIVGGFCPGTSLVAAATLKIDGIIFVLGGLVGVTLFGETEKFFDAFYNGSYYGRLTLMDVFNLPTGVIVLGVTLMALFMFWAGDQIARIVSKEPMPSRPRWHYVGAAGLVATALVVVWLGQPTTEDKWTRLAPAKMAALTERTVQIEPAELLTSMADDKLNMILLDVRPETDYNLFHILGARHTPLSAIPALVPELLLEPAANTVYVLMSNDEGAATEAWKTLVAESVPNVYILGGGINSWIATFGKDEPGIHPTPTPPGNDQLHYVFASAIGDRYSAADPNVHELDLKYEPKIKLQRKKGPTGGGCG